MAGKRGPSAGKHKGETLAALRNAFDILVRLQQGGLVPDTDRPQGDGVTLDALANDLGLTTKQVGRYLDVLQDFGVHFALDDSGRRSEPLRVTSAVRRPPFNVLFLTEDELILLYARLAGLHSAGTDEDRRRLWDKVRRSVAAKPVDAVRVDGVLRNLGKAGKRYDDPTRRRILGDLLEALYQNEVCTVTYRRPDGRVGTYSIEPYELVEHDGGLYLYSRAPAYDNVIVQAVERIQALERTGNPFARRAAVQQRVRDMQRNAFGIYDDREPLDVELRFSSAVAFYADERAWHHTERKAWNDDGSLTLTFRASGRIEIERWIRSWGDDVTVVRMAPAGA